ncbi:MAG TPA: NAD(P)H-dependent oxidoreductase [Solirubrobacterales bacterium]|jgi:chromate reductase|nr:NAD(P)H-dependent oxidoreductase [Solirubrobacterales bacterium]
MRVIAISGSLRRDSHNTALLRTAAELLPPSAELEIFDGLKLVEPYDQDDDTGRGPDGARRLREAIESADAVLIASPEYNSSIPGVLKNALDWASRPKGENALWGKPAAVVGASTGMFGAVWAQAETRKVLSASGARVIETDLPIGHADQAISDDGRLTDIELRERYVEILDELIALAEQVGDGGSSGEPQKLAA